MNAIEVMQMQVAELRELDADRRARDELIAVAVNALEVIERGRGAAGEKINRKAYARGARAHIEKLWNECMPIEPLVGPNGGPYVPQSSSNTGETK